jgi:exopolyphosphatase/guanosine-5'-triphosphate,3'-diphosphate pyrophosphatase
MPSSHAVIDIGSNTVRLAVFRGTPPNHRRIENRKARCRLADGLDRTGDLSPEGVRKALKAISDYAEIATEQDVESVHMVATAAVRDAKDGVKFVKRLEKLFGYRVDILDELEEARLSALGFLSGCPKPDKATGLIADLGGGSLDVVTISKGVMGKSVSLPLGHIRLSEKAGNDIDDLDRLIRKELAVIDHMDVPMGGKLMLTGGAFRKFARLDDGSSGGENSIDGLSIRAAAARKKANRILKHTRKAKGGAVGSTLIASRLICGLLDASEGRRVVFSERGLMDGCYLANCASRKEQARAMPALDKAFRSYAIA